MAKPGRNDPCPCGSGKKYKSCCLGKDRTNRIRDLKLTLAERDTLERLIAFAQQPEFHAQYIVASNLFWNGNYGVEGLSGLSRVELARFLDWFVFVYSLEGIKRRIIDLFLDEEGGRLPSGELQQVRGWRQSIISLYRIQSHRNPGAFVVLDVLQDIEAEAAADGVSRLGIAGDLVLGRLLQAAPWRFSWAAILLPGELEEALAAIVRGAYREHKGLAPGATWVEFLSQHGYLFNHQLLRWGAEAGARGQKGRYYDAWDTVEALRKAEKHLAERAAAETAGRLKKAGEVPTEPPDQFPLSPGGILLPRRIQQGDG